MPERPVMKEKGQKVKATPAKTEKVVKTEKKETKVENKETKKEVKTEKKVVKKKFIQFVEKIKQKKPKEVIEIQKSLGDKKSHPVFRGRFGKKQFRRKSIEKWDKWRKPHGIDIDRCLAHGRRPKIGYRSDANLRDIHPSGYKEVLVCNVKDLAKINNKTEAARISRTVGKRKRNEIVKKANESAIWVLN
jgi:large subunit ribosomal protein L32e